MVSSIIIQVTIKRKEMIKKQKKRKQVIQLQKLPHPKKPKLQKTHNNMKLHQLLVSKRELATTKMVKRKRL